jgi:hypothetical protein
MTEREYIDATNLAKIRAAKAILRDVLEMDDREKKLRMNASEALSAYEAKLEKVVKTRG